MSSSGSVVMQPDLMPSVIGDTEPSTPLRQIGKYMIVLNDLIVKKLLTNLLT